MRCSERSSPARTRTSQSFASVQSARCWLESFPAPLERLARLACRGPRHDEPGHDLSLAALAEALADATVHLKVYRSYLDGKPPSRFDRARLERAFAPRGHDLEVTRATELIKRAILERARPASAWLEVAAPFNSCPAR